MGRTRRILVAGVAMAVIAVVVFRAHKLRGRLLCAGHIKTISFTCQDFAASGAGAFAVWLEDQIRQGAIRVDQVTCPVGAERYVCRPNPGDVDDPEMVLCYEPLANHGNGANVLFADGHATFLNQDELSALLDHGELAQAEGR